MTGLITCVWLATRFKSNAHDYTYGPVVHSRDGLVNVFVRVESTELLDW
jgi:uncharacterized membrane protein